MEDRDKAQGAELMAGLDVPSKAGEVLHAILIDTRGLFRGSSFVCGLSAVLVP